MEKLPLISVIIPVYNVRDYVDRCLASVCAQTHRNLEIVVVDDGSTDGSSELCDDFARRDSRVRVLHRPNDGLSVARNAGLAVATGDYVGFVDGDDWIETDMYECLYALLAGCDADIAACSHFRDKGRRSTAVHATGCTFVYSRDEAFAQLAEDKRIRNYAVDKLYRRSLFEDIVFPPGRYFEDIAVMCRLFAKARVVAFREVPKYHYCVRQGSIMQGRYNPLKEYHFFFAQFVYGHLNHAHSALNYLRPGCYNCRCLLALKHCRRYFLGVCEVSDSDFHYFKTCKLHLLGKGVLHGLGYLLGASSQSLFRVLIVRSRIGFSKVVRIKPCGISDGGIGLNGEKFAVILNIEYSLCRIYNPPDNHGPYDDRISHDVVYLLDSVV